METALFKFFDLGESLFDLIKDEARQGGYWSDFQTDWQESYALVNLWYDISVWEDGDIDAAGNRFNSRFPITDDTILEFY